MQHNEEKSMAKDLLQLEDDEVPETPREATKSEEGSLEGEEAEKRRLRREEVRELMKVVEKMTEAQMRGLVDKLGSHKRTG